MQFRNLSNLLTVALALVTVNVIEGASISLLNLTATPQCLVEETADQQPFVQCSDLTPASMDQLNQALTDADTFYTSNYQLLISNSDLSALTTEFSGHHIDTLWLESDGLTALPIGPISYLDIATTVNIYDNSINKIDKFVGPATLTTVDLASNNLNSWVDSPFSDLPALDSLSLYSNIFDSINNTLLTGLPVLQTLLLDKNRIKDIAPGTFLGLSNITSVNLTSNYMTILTDGAFSGLESADVLLLADNPFVCNCEMQWMKEWLQHNDKANSSGAVCVTPPGANFIDSTPFTC